MCYIFSFRNFTSKKDKIIIKTWIFCLCGIYLVKMYDRSKFVLVKVK